MNLEDRIHNIIYNHLKPGTDKGSTQAIIDIKDIKEAAKSIANLIKREYISMTKND